MPRVKRSATNAVQSLNANRNREASRREIHLKAHIGFALMVLVLMLAGAGVAQGQPQGQQQSQIPVRDGYWWTNQAQDFKLGFVTGFAVAMTGNSDAAVVRCIATKPGGAEKASGEEWKACTQAPEVVMLSYTLRQIVVSVSKHLTAVIDGVIHDTHDCSRSETRCVYGYWQSPTAMNLC